MKSTFSSSVLFLFLLLYLSSGSAGQVVYSRFLEFAGGNSAMRAMKGKQNSTIVGWNAETKILLMDTKESCNNSLGHFQYTVNDQYGSAHLVARHSPKSRNSSISS